MRWLSIDHGTKKIGLAFCDELELIASPFEVWPMEGETTLERLAKLVKAEGAQALLVGLPRHKDGQESATAPLARAFGESLAARTALPLRFLDEHLTSAEAERLLAQRGVKPKDRKARLDAAAAAVLLQEWLDERRAKRIPASNLEAV
ncbi:MAG: Holliday junction resolvase RuvX [Firmicutes bacterium]|nr:Holliday junction resolvase RuvX [Bacillota bacterium]